MLSLYMVAAVAILGAPARVYTEAFIVPRDQPRLSTRVVRVSGATATPVDSATAVSAELSTLLIENWNNVNDEQSDRVRERMDELIDTLAAGRAPFPGLEEGLWCAAYTRGARVPRWKRYADLGFTKNRNVAGQDYDVAAAQVG